MMTKTKKSENRSHSQRATSGDVAVTNVSSNAALPADQGHATECLDPTEGQVFHERPSDDFDMAIRELAYSKWEAAGFPEGDGFDFWLEAERELKASQQASSPRSE